MPQSSLPGQADVDPIVDEAARYSISDEFKTAGKQAIATSAFIYLLNRLAPIHPAVNVSLYAGIHGLCLWRHRLMKTAIAGALQEVVREGPFVRPPAEMSPVAIQAPVVAAYISPILVGLLAQVPRKRVLGGLVVLCKLLVADAVAWALPGLLRRDTLSVTVAGGAGVAVLLLGFDWRYIALMGALRFARVGWPLLAKVRIFGGMGTRQPMYKYTEITKDGRIRLLKIEPSIFGLTCSLLEQDLATTPPFEAMSYR